MESNPYLSFILPIYNEEENIDELYLKLTKILGEVALRYELIFINDGSKDNSFLKLQSLRKKDKNIKIIDFSRNFGQESAISCGIDYASGDVLVVMDADLQDPPDVIADLIKKWQNGANIVWARRQKRYDSFFKKLSAYFFHLAFNKICYSKIPKNIGNFYLIDKKVAYELRKLKEKNRFTRGLISWLGFRQSEVFYNREKRRRGKGGYSLRKMINLAFDAIFSFSYFPIRLAVYLALFFLILGISTIFISQENQILNSKSLFLVIFLITGLGFLILGILGEYLARIYQQLQNRPLYIINRLIGFSNNEED